MLAASITESQKKALAVATIIALVGGAFFLEPYFSLIAFASILAFMFNGIYHRFERRWQNPNRSSFVTLIIAMLTLIIPAALVIAVSIKQVDHLADSIDSSTVTTYINEAVDGVNQTLSKVGIDYTLNQESVTNALEEPLKNLGESTLQSIPGLFSSFFNFFSVAIIFFFVFLSLLKNQRALVRTAHALNPLGREISQLYLQKIAAMTKAMVRGQFIIATAQGFTDAALLAIAGLPELFFFFFLLLTALSIIPLGGGIVAIPIGILMILTGNVWGGLIVIVGHLVIVTNIDNVLRPQLVPKEAKLDSALTLLSVFAGLKMFGFLGIVIGPVIMILIVTTIRVYEEVHGEKLKEAEKSDGHSIFARTSARVKKVFRR